MPRPSGILWEHFEHVQEAGKVATAKCKKCFKTFSIKNSNTSGMLKHLKVMHPQIFKDVLKSKVLARRSKEEAFEEIDAVEEQLCENSRPETKTPSRKFPDHSSEQETQQNLR